jgi:hypothetical protein
VLSEYGQSKPREPGPSRPTHRGRVSFSARSTPCPTLSACDVALRRPVYSVRTASCMRWCSLRVTLDHLRADALDLARVPVRSGSTIVVHEPLVPTSSSYDLDTRRCRPRRTRWLRRPDIGPETLRNSSVPAESPSPQPDKGQQPPCRWVPLWLREAGRRKSAHMRSCPPSRRGERDASLNAAGRAGLVTPGSYALRLFESPERRSADLVVQGRMEREGSSHWCSVREQQEFPYRI